MAVRAKSNKTVTFVGDDGTELEVVTSIEPSALQILKNMGYKKKSSGGAKEEAVTREEEEAEEEEAPRRKPARRT